MDILIERVREILFLNNPFGFNTAGECHSGSSGENDEGQKIKLSFCPIKVKLNDCDALSG